MRVRDLVAEEARTVTVETIGLGRIAWRYACDCEACAAIYALSRDPEVRRHAVRRGAPGSFIWGYEDSAAVALGWAP